MEETYGEFSFNGHSCTEFGLHYIPAASDRWFSSVSWKNKEEVVTGKAGAYYYGTTVDARDFSLECYFEDATVEQLEAIERWLNRFTEGKLVFDDRPYVYYLVRPSAPSKGQTWAQQYLSSIGLIGGGKCTISFKAYFPYGILDRNTFDPTTTLNTASIIHRTGLMPTAKMPPLIGHEAGSYLVYNPGVEFTYPTIKLYGSAPNGLTIENHTTNEKCTLTAFNLADETYLEVNAETGVRIQPMDTLAFEYHLDGYISLAPSIPYERNVAVACTSGSNEVILRNHNGLDDNYVGEYIFLDGAWRQILYVRSDKKTLVINHYMSKTTIETTDIVVMNEIEIIGDGLALTDVKMEYKAYVR